MTAGRYSRSDSHILAARAELCAASGPKNIKRWYRPYIPVRPSCSPMFDNLQPASWDGHPVSLGNGFELQEAKGDRRLHAICSLQTHRFGWRLCSKSMACCHGRRSVARATGV